MNLFETIGQVFTDPSNVWGEVTGSNRAKENLAFQKENLEYQKQLQQQIFQREDTAYQRSVDDMSKAGLNPLTMTGTNGAGQPIQTEAPQQDVQAFNNLNHIQNITDQFNNIVNGISERHEREATTQKAEAETNLINAQALSKDIENMFLKDSLQADYDYKRSQADRSKRVNDFQAKYGINDDSAFFRKYATEFQDMIDSKQLFNLSESLKSLGQQGKQVYSGLFGNGDSIPFLPTPSDVSNNFKSYMDSITEEAEKKKQAKQDKKNLKKAEKSAQKIRKNQKRYYDKYIYDLRAKQEFGN